ncbi:MAG: hypothetical protein H0W24_09780, partial [Lysobacter sp.]|nr:hypothetical protein [Lysobacter sp.]
MDIDFPTPGETQPSAEDQHALLRLIACGGPLAPRRRLLEECPQPCDALAAGPARWRACG